RLDTSEPLVRPYPARALVIRPGSASGRPNYGVTKGHQRERNDRRDAQTAIGGPRNCCDSQNGFRSQNKRISVPNADMWCLTPKLSRDASWSEAHCKLYLPCGLRNEAASA